MSKAIEQSIKEKVKSIAHTQSRTFNDVWQEVVLERWLARLAVSPYRKNFIFKGAMCLLRYVDLQRETRDLDFLLKDLTSSMDDVRKYLTEVSAIILNDSFSFENLEVINLSHIHMKYPGYQVSVTGKLENTRTRVFIDIGVGDAVKPTEITMKLISTGKSPLFEKEIHLWAYPVESIFAEKLETAVTRSDQNSRMKDYHDLLILIQEQILDDRKIVAAIQETFDNRGTKFQNINIPKNQFSTIQNYWDLYLKALQPDTRKQLPSDLESVITEINSYLSKHRI